MNEPALHWYKRLISAYTVRGLSLGWRRLTASWRALPDVFIIGSMKCGTTSLAHALTEHPAYVPAFTKELKFLQELPNFKSRYETNALSRFAWGQYRHGLDSYRKFFPLGRTMRQVEERSGLRARTGDHTPFYLYSEEAAERIRSFSPRAKLIVMLRDPVKRAFSDYRMMRQLGAEERTFEQALDDELSGANDKFLFTYLHKGIYEPHLRVWRSRFAREQILLIPSERYFKDSVTVLSEVYDFLEWPSHPPEKRPEVKNRGRVRETLTPDTRDRLKAFYQPHNEKLYDYLGRDFGWGDSKVTRPLEFEEKRS